MAENESSAPETTNYEAPLLSNPVIVPAGLHITAMFRALLAGRHDVSLIVHENTAAQMKDYRNNYGYMFPAVVVETLWNVLLVVHSVVALLWCARDESNVMLRVWICGYSVHCVVNVVLLVMEYVKRNDMSVRRVPSDPNASVPGMSSGYSTNSDGGDLPPVPPTRWDLLNTGVSCFWWVLGFILMVFYSSSATPCLFWLTVAYLAMDVFFLVLATAVFCSIE